MKFFPSLPTRKLGTSLLYLCSAIFSIIQLNLIASTLSTLELTLSALGISAWGVAGVQSVYRKYQARKHYLETTEPTPCIKGSTHSLINSALHITSASLFITTDAISPPPLSIAEITRLSGSALWLSSAINYGLLAITHERKQEADKNAIVKPCGISSDNIELISEIEYLASGFLYTASIWTNETIYPLKAAGNVCWLLAGLHDTIHALSKIECKKQEPTMSAVSNVVMSPLNV